ncbi:MAG: type IX secretion system protein PorG [Bacteroidia bacterium]
MKKVTLIIFFLFLFAGGFAQKHPNKPYMSHDVGIFLGGCYYIGDLNPTKHFVMSQPGIGAWYRFNLNYRVAFRGGINFGTVQGDDSRSENPDQLERNLNFKSRITEFYGQAEFNFWEYKVGHQDYIFAPYIFLGLAGFHFNPQANLGNQWVNLKPLSTEGEGTAQDKLHKPYKLTQMSIPFGIGFKLSFANQIGLGFEWGPRKTFTDYIDDVSGKYVDLNKLAIDKGSLAAVLSDRSVSKDPSVRLNNNGKLRGNPNNKDWYFYYGLVISFKLKGKPKECKGVGK